MSEWPRSLVLTGAGKMGEALLRGWLAGGLAPKRVTILEPNRRRRSPRSPPSAALRSIRRSPGWRRPRFCFSPSSRRRWRRRRPTSRRSPAPRRWSISILAGKRVADLAARLPHARAFARVMPNTPAAVGRGASAAFASPATSARQRQWTQSLMSAVGQFDWLADETLIDAVTAISGSGPAYVFALVEAMAEAGEKLGLPAELAMKLARATVEGAGELLHREPAVTAAKLRENVTSPGGTTAAALAILRAPDGYPALLAKAAAAARDRARELAG